MTTIDFMPSSIPDDIMDSIPDVSDVDYPCEVCGQESGPYGGRGPKPKRCPIHKKGRAKTNTVKVSGATSNRAAQAAGVLEQLNGMLALGLMAVGFNETAHALAAGNEGFKEAAYQALTTDDELCKLILKGGGKSAKVGLVMAYGMLGTAVIPVGIAEAKLKKEERLARAEADETGA
jgi:hypothetical protein